MDKASKSDSTTVLYATRYLKLIRKQNDKEAVALLRTYRRELRESHPIKAKLYGLRPSGHPKGGPRRSVVNAQAIIIALACDEGGFKPSKILTILRKPHGTNESPAAYRWLARRLKAGRNLVEIGHETASKARDQLKRLPPSERTKRLTRLLRDSLPTSKNSVS